MSRLIDKIRLEFIRKLKDANEQSCGNCQYTYKTLRGRFMCAVAYQAVLLSGLQAEINFDIETYTDEIKEGKRELFIPDNCFQSNSLDELIKNCNLPSVEKYLVRLKDKVTFTQSITENRWGKDLFAKYMSEHDVHADFGFIQKEEYYDLSTFMGNEEIF